MFRSKSKEIDPLLPQNETSPEIQTYGSATYKGTSEISFNGAPAYGQNELQHETVHPDAPKQESSTSDHSTRSSAWGTVIALLTCIVFFALILVALKSGDGFSESPSLIPILGSPQGSNLTFDERVMKILRDTPLIDGHNDLAITIRSYFKNDIHSSNFKDKWENGGLDGQVDLPRLKTGMVGGAFWSAFVSCPANASFDFSDAEYGTPVAHTIQQIDLIKRLQGMYPTKFSNPTLSIAEMLIRFHSSQTMFGPISIEGLHQVPQSAALSTLRLYYELGVRMATLTWNCNNAFADAALIYENGTSKPSKYGRSGLTKAGRELIHEMNRIGMLVDLSHTSYWTQKATLSDETSRSPVVFSHSSAYALCPHPRNVKDDILELVKATNSIVQVNFSPDFISCEAVEGSEMPQFYAKNNTLHQVARHIVYIGDKIGYDHVGLGSDFDGIGTVLPEGLDGVDKFPDLIKELLKMGVSDADASKVVGGNVLRVWRAAEQVSQNMKEEGAQEGKDEVHGEYARMLSDEL